MQRLELSHQQRRTWQMRSLGLTVPDTNLEFTVSGQVDRGRLEAAISAVVDRHEILRTRIEPQVGLSVPVQVTYESALALKNAAGQHEGTVDIALNSEKSDCVRICLSASAMLLDRFSCRLFFDQIAENYAGVQQADEALQYADYAAWIDESMTMADTEVGRAFWEARDCSSVDDFKLAVARSVPAGQTVGKATTLLDPATVDALKQYARAREVAVETLITSAWLILLYRHGATDEVTLGLGRELRPFDDLRTGMGIYHQHVPLTVALDGDYTFDDINTLVGTELTQIDEWQDCFSWELLVKNHASSMRYLIDFSSSAGNIVKNDTTFEIGLIESHSEPFELKLELQQEPDGNRITANLWFDESRIEPHQAERFIAQLELLIVDALEHENRTIGRLRMMTDDEASIALNSFNDTQIKYSPDTATLVSLFQDAVARFGNQPAVSFGTETITYNELESRSNQVAHMLADECSIESECIVALMMSRSMELLPAMYGILKTGAAYLPMDDDYPDERVRHILREADVKYVLCDRGYMSRFEALGVTAICIADVEPGAYSGEPLAVEIKPGSAAYVIYTSGSTGLPKGVINEHRSVCNLMFWLQDEFPLTAHDRVLQKTPYTFDVSVPEFFWPLETGAQVVVAAPDGHRDAGYLVDVIRQAKITVTSFVPTMMRLFLEHPDVSSCTTLERILCAGEMLVGDLKKRFQTLLPTTRLFNLYGPTEAAVYVTTSDCEIPSPYGVVPIGRPIANTKIHVLDDELRPVPIGVQGELYIGGVQVARGYVNRDDLTAERFIDDPFSQGRLYKSGDLARWLPDGTIAYIGRADSQIKLRGLRIELGEIEEVISSHPDIAQCVVVVWDFSDTDRRLVAYLVGTENAKLDISGIHDHVAAKVPDYMVPAHLEELSNLPTTSSGKIDRKKLPEPKQLESAGEYVAPRNAIEQYLADSWQSMLKTNAVGIHDSFFELGGDSLQAAIFCNGLSAIVDSYVSVVAVFEHDTPEEFANFLVANYPTVADNLSLANVDDRIRESSDTIVPIPDRSATLPLTPYQARTWFIDALEGRNPAYNTMIGLEMRGAVDVAALRSAIRQLIDRHEILRTCYRVANGRLVQTLTTIEEAPFSVVPMDTSLSDEIVVRLVSEEARRTFDLEAGEVIHATLYCGTDNSSLLLVDVHQIATDAWCRDLLVAEISALYRAYVDANATLPDLPPLQHGDFVLWNRDRLAGPDGDSARAFWADLLGGRTQILDLPTDKLRPTVKSNNGASIQRNAAESLSKRLLQMSGQEHVSSFMIMMTGFFVLLAKYCNQQDLVIGSTVACRERDETHRLVGRIANMIAVPASVDPDATFSSLLGQVRDNLLGALTHQEYPLASVISELAPARDLSQTPLYQVVFAGETKARDLAQLPGLDARCVTIDKKLAKYDMTFVIVDDDNELIIDLEYNTDLFNDASMKRLLDDYEALLEKLLDDPTALLTSIQLEQASDRLSHSANHHWSKGFPVDVDRVRNALLALDPIQQCDLSVRTLDGQEVLVACYTGTETAPDRLHQLLAWQVPASMLPAAYHYVDTLKGATRQVPDSALTGRRETGHDPGDRLEAQIIDQWRELVAIADIKPNDDFFACGGNSILALEAANRAARSFGVPITLRHFFEASSPRALANLIRALRFLTAPDGQASDKQEFRV